MVFRSWRASVGVRVPGGGAGCWGISAPGRRGDAPGLGLVRRKMLDSGGTAREVNDWLGTELYGSYLPTEGIIVETR